LFVVVVLGVGMAVAILACVSLMVVLAVVGALRMRSTREPIRDVNIDDKQEMEWDNSELTITVNPMENQVSPSPVLLQIVSPKEIFSSDISYYKIMIVFTLYPMLPKYQSFQLVSFTIQSFHFVSFMICL